MAMDFEADLDVFLDPDVFGVEVLVGPEGDEEPIPGSFENPFQSVGAGQYTDISTSAPVLILKQSDVTGLGIVRNTRIVVDEIVYLAKDTEPDGTGYMVRVPLKKG